MLTLIYLKSRMYPCNLLWLHLTHVNRNTVLYTEYTGLYTGLKAAEFLISCFSSECHVSDPITLTDSKLVLMSM